MIYIWHKENSALIETLKGHGKSLRDNNCCVTSVSWNPVNSGMFASGGDDRKVRIWTNNVDDNATNSVWDPRMAHPDLHRMSALRSTSNS